MNLSALRSKLFPALSAAVVLALCALTAFGWGAFAHELASRSAVALLPDELKGFFDANAVSLKAFSLEPDAVSVIDSSTGPNHFIDLDVWSTPPFDDVPSDQAQFLATFGPDALQHGRLPWAIRDEYDALVDAFAKRDVEAVLKHAGWLSHYVSDATMPLHSTKNYKGQFSGNIIFNDSDDSSRHVHVRFEIAMIDANKPDFTKRILLGPRDLHSVDDPAEEALAIAKLSYDYAAAVLDADREFLKPGGRVDTAYLAKMYAKVGDLAARQVALAAVETACFWRSAWHKAGEPKFFPARVVLSKPPLTLDDARAIRQSRNSPETSK